MTHLASETRSAYGQKFSTVLPVLKECIKRDGRRVPFDPDRIVAALRKCFASACTLPQGEQDALVEKITARVVRQLSYKRIESVGVEAVQDAVIGNLWGEGLSEEATHYSNYREERRKARYNRPVSDVAAARVRSDRKHFTSDLQYFQFMDKFSRWLPAEKRRETWEEAVFQRVLPFLFNRPKVKDKLTTEEREFLGKYMYELKAGPAMRVVQMAGPALERCNFGVFNCSYLPITDVQSFGELLYILMQGTGAGFSVEYDYIGDLPRVKKQTGEEKVVIVVEDTTESWCDALVRVIELLLSGRDFTVDTSRVRKKGARLKTKGGRASGPEPLIELLDFVRRTILHRQGRRLSDLDVHDICCMIGNIVQVGGVRRAALISLSDLNSREMRDAKSGTWWDKSSHRSMANNSAVYYERPTPEVFLEEWRALVGSKSGERGICNRAALERSVPERRQKRSDFGFNPCFAADTLITTREYGAVPIVDLVGKTATVFDGLSWREIDNFRVTGHNQPMLKITLQDGSTLRVTDYHTMVLAGGNRIEAHELVVGDWLSVAEVGTYDGPNRLTGAYLKGFLLGDGTLIDANRPRLHLYQPKYGCKDRLLASAVEVPVGEIRTGAIEALGWGPAGADNRVNLTGLSVRQADLRAWCSDYKLRLPKDVFALDRQSKCELLAGLFDADGCVVDSENGFSYQLSSIRREFLQDVQVLLKSLGVQSKIGVMHPARRKEMPGGVYDCQASYRLTVGQAGAIALARQVTFSRLPSFADRSTKYNVKPRWHQVASVEPDGVDPIVYCCTVPDTHTIATAIGVVTGQCGEIILRPYGVCNLSIAVARPDDTEETLTQKVVAAAYFGSIQATCTDFKYVRDEWRKNAEEEALLGVDITGHADCPLLFASNPDRDAMLERMRRKVNEVNADLAARFGINRSAADTCVKPSGDSAIFFDCGSGISARFAECQWRYVRASKESSMAKFLIDQGVPYADAPERPNELHVFGFLKEAPAGSVKRNDQTAIEQLENWLRWKRNWAEHSVSATIYVEEWEWLAVGAWVYEHFDEITGLSFLPKDNGVYKYAPNVELTREEYDAESARFPGIEWEKLSLYEDDDETGARTTMACVGGPCD